MVKHTHITFQYWQDI